MLTNPELRRIVVNHVHDLVALARDAAEVANGRGLRAARLHAIKADIRASLGEQGLSLTTTAARHGVTPRCVQTLFESDGTTFSHSCSVKGSRARRRYGATPSDVRAAAERERSG
jgi:hypothetical protein